jgi:CRISPR-associated protein Cas5t
MKLYRIKISSWTSSFRYPNVISGTQPTLHVPPLSTVLGLISACSGKYLEFQNFELGYYFDYEAKCIDLETIYQISLSAKNTPSNQVKSNVIKREFLFNCRLFLYISDVNVLNFLRSPQYQILLGRSNDIATIEEIREVDLKEMRNATKIKGQIVPFVGNFLPGTLQALPKYFTNTIPRNNLGTEAFSVIDFNAADYESNVLGYRDVIDDKEIDIYIHNISDLYE